MLNFKPNSSIVNKTTLINNENDQTTDEQSLTDYESIETDNDSNQTYFDCLTDIDNSSNEIDNLIGNGNNIIENDNKSKFNQTEYNSFENNENNLKKKREFLIELGEMKKLGLPTSFSTKTKSKTKKLDNSSFIIEQYKLRKLELFSQWSRFKNVCIDRESLYSITPEIIARNIALKCKEKTNYTIVIDGFCGVGGNLIQFAVNNSNSFIIGIDTKYSRLENARKIASFYDVSHQCDFICGDFLQVVKVLNIKPDVVFLSPPWGGVDYKKKKQFYLNHMPIDGIEIYIAARDNLTKNIAYYLPRNLKISELKKLDEDYCIHKNLRNNYLSTLTAYFGDLKDNDSNCHKLSFLKENKSEENQ